MTQLISYLSVSVSLVTYLSQSLPKNVRRHFRDSCACILGCTRSFFDGSGDASQFASFTRNIFSQITSCSPELTRVAHRFMQRVALALEVVPAEISIVASCFVVPAKPFCLQKSCVTEQAVTHTVNVETRVLRTKYVHSVETLKFRTHALTRWDRSVSSAQFVE